MIIIMIKLMMITTMAMVMAMAKIMMMTIMHGDTWHH